MIKSSEQELATHAYLVQDVVAPSFGGKFQVIIETFSAFFDHSLPSAVVVSLSGQPLDFHFFNEVVGAQNVELFLWMLLPVPLGPISFSRSRKSNHQDDLNEAKGVRKLALPSVGP